MSAGRTLDPYAGSIGSTDDVSYAGRASGRMSNGRPPTSMDLIRNVFTASLKLMPQRAYTACAPDFTSGSTYDFTSALLAAIVASLFKPRLCIV